MDDATRWAAVVRRSPAHDGTFVYCVKSTKIFCRPICKARLARRMNVEFCDTPAQATAKGYRPCKRCKPLLREYNPEREKVMKACEVLRALPKGAPVPGLEALAREVGLTKFHFHRLFRREVGCTPREFAAGCRKGNGGGDGEAPGSVMESASSVEDGLSPVTPFTNQSEAPVQIADEDPTAAAEDVDWSSLVNDQDLYGFDLIGYSLGDGLVKDLAPANVDVLIIYFSIVETTYGNLLVAFRGDQVCKLELGSSEAELMASLEASFSSMYYIHSHVSLAIETDAVTYQQRIDAVVDALEFPTGKMLDVPLALEASESNALP